MSKGCYFIEKSPISEGQRLQLVDGVIASEYYGDSALGIEFVDTKGFSIVFKRSAFDVVDNHFPYLSRLFDKVLYPSSNAFYINPLVLRGQSRVDAHIDCRMVPQTNIRIIPNLISVYYAMVPADIMGGRLVLNSGSKDEFGILPETGDVIHFLGSVVHHVEEMVSSDPRISIVCEQYNLDDDVLSQFPDCEVITGASDFRRLNAL